MRSPWRAEPIFGGVRGGTKPPGSARADTLPMTDAEKGQFVVEQVRGTPKLVGLDWPNFDADMKMIREDLDRGEVPVG